jgi:hypothetical protein
LTRDVDAPDHAVAKKNLRADQERERDDKDRGKNTEREETDG